jgi:hypothetical protein
MWVLNKSLTAIVFDALSVVNNKKKTREVAVGLVRTKDSNLYYAAIRGFSKACI